MGDFGLPFEVGQLAESTSFDVGFRGSWFRCKIRDIRLRRKEIEHALEFYDFPDEEVKWNKLYQKPIGGHKSKEMKRQIMVRPSFPPIFRESQMPDVDNITEVVVIVNDVWKVGDLVDWWTDNCYWTARITKMLEDGKARIELPPPPVGEGSSYEAPCEELRPTLEWSPDDGWTVPIAERENSCARVIKPVNPVNKEGSPNLMVPPVEEATKIAEPTAGTVDCNGSFSSHMPTSSLPSLDQWVRHAKRPLSPAASKETRALETKMGFDVENEGVGKSSFSDSVSSSHIGDATAEMPRSHAGYRGDENGGSLKKMRDDINIPLNSLFSDTIEAAMIDYEELVNRVKWIKGILQLGTTPSKTVTVRPSWKFVEQNSVNRKKD